MYVCVCACDGAGRLRRATEAGSNSKPNELAVRTSIHTHSSCTHTHAHTLPHTLLLSAGSRSCFNPGTQKKKKERSKRQRVAERESEGAGVREERGRERQRETGGVWGRTPWLQIQGWLRCCYGLYLYRLWAPQELTATKVRVCVGVLIGLVKQCIFSYSRAGKHWKWAKAGMTHAYTLWSLLCAKTQGNVQCLCVCMNYYIFACQPL